MSQVPVPDAIGGLLERQLERALPEGRRHERHGVVQRVAEADVDVPIPAGVVLAREPGDSEHEMVAEGIDLGPSGPCTPPKWRVTS